MHVPLSVPIVSQAIVIKNMVTYNGTWSFGLEKERGEKKNVEMEGDEEEEEDEEANRVARL